MVARVYVTLKPGVLDPAGKAVERSLHSMGYAEVMGLRLGKYIELNVEETDPAKAKARVEEMCKKLLANTVVEDYRVELG
jgi:phosphoribosylformylglycinamidine synthase